MKKLLALILCVMMFVAVIPTAAFADPAVNYTNLDRTETNAKKLWSGAYAASKAVEDMSDAVKAMYGSIAANQGVFNTVVAIDDTVKSIAEGMFEGLDTLTMKASNGTTEKFTTNKQLTDATKNFLKEHVGKEITKYMNEHSSEFTDSKTIGTGAAATTEKIINPIKYMNTFATAASKAMSSEKAVKNIEALYYVGAFAKAQKEAKDKMEDLYDDYRAWGGKFSDYGWTDITANTGWDPYVFLDAQDPYYDYTANSNIDAVLGDFIARGN